MLDEKKWGTITKIISRLGTEDHRDRITAMLAEGGCNWSDVANRLSGQVKSSPSKPEGQWQYEPAEKTQYEKTMERLLARKGYLSEWERGFVESIHARAFKSVEQLSEKQRAVLRRIWAGVKARSPTD